MAMVQLKANSTNPEESREKGNSNKGRVLHNRKSNVVVTAKISIASC
jgi:hypothetical protein